MPTAANVLLTGKPFGPEPARPRGASKASSRSGPPMTCPAAIAPSPSEAAPTPPTSARRVSVGAAGATRRAGRDPSRPRSGSVRARSARSGRMITLLRERAPRDRDLEPHVQRQRGDEHDRAVVVRRHEREPERVPELDVDHAGREREQAAADEQREAEPLERVRDRARGRVLEQLRDDRPELREQDRDRREAATTWRPCVSRVEPARARRPGERVDDRSRCPARGRRTARCCRAGAGRRGATASR